MVCPFARPNDARPKALSACPFSGTPTLKCQFSAASGPAPQQRPGQLLAEPTSSTTSSDAGDAADLTSSSSSASSSSDTYVHQAWQHKRPVLQHDPKLTRRQLRKLGRSWSLAEVAQHKYCDDGWIAVDGRVYDITEHIASHPGWDSGCRVTEVLSIIAHLGCDCSTEFHEIHRAYPVSYKQLAAFYIGELQQQQP